MRGELFSVFPPFSLALFLFTFCAPYSATSPPLAFLFLLHNPTVRRAGALSLPAFVHALLPYNKSAQYMFFAQRLCLYFQKTTFEIKKIKISGAYKSLFIKKSAAKSDFYCLAFLPSGATSLWSDAGNLPFAN